MRRRRTRHAEIDAAITDLTDRTLAEIPSELGRLLYLASTRDYNTGHYYHEGLAARFSEEIAAAALAECHLDIFHSLVYGSLQELAREVQVHLSGTGSRVDEVVRFWRRLEPYRVTLPMECHPLTAELFFSNLRVALAIVHARLGNFQESPPPA